MKINPAIQILKSVLSNWLDNQIQLFVEYSKANQINRLLAD